MTDQGDKSRISREAYVRICGSREKRTRELREPRRMAYPTIHLKRGDA
jgi:hypothetical protein